MFVNDLVITLKGSQLKTGCNIKLIHIFLRDSNFAVFTDIKRQSMRTYDKAFCLNIMEHTIHVAINYSLDCILLDSRYVERSSMLSNVDSS